MSTAFASALLPYTDRVWAIYVRISNDRTGAGLGVQRQEIEVRAMIRRLDPDAVVVEVYIDNDVSASNKRKKRKDYERMISDIEAGKINAVGCWHLDRVTRRNLELEYLCQYAEELGTLFAAVHGDIDLRTSTGRMSARFFAAAARREVEQKVERQKSANRQRALNGESWCGGMRPYGYTKDGKTVVEEEAAVLREAARRVVAGDSLRSIILDFDRRGILSATGKPWQSVSLRRVLQNPRIAGFRTLEGEKVAKGTWDAILTEEEQARVVAILSNPDRNSGGGGGVRKHLLSGGLLMCGMPGCGKPLQSQPSNSGSAGYVCRKNPPIGGCGRIRIAAEPLEKEVAERVLGRYASPAVARRLAEAMTANSETEILDQIKEYEDRIEAIAGEYATGQMSKGAFQAAERRATREIQLLRAQIKQSVRMSNLPEGLTPLELAQWWTDAPLERRRDLVSTVLDHISVGPVTRVGYGGLDLNRLNWVWRT